MRCLLSLLVALSAAFAAVAMQSVYDDLGVPDSCRNDAAFWTLTGHAGPTVDTSASSAADIDASAPVAVSAATPLSVFDSRWWFCREVDAVLVTTPPGFLLFLR